MYYFSKFCRICIQTDVKLVDISTLDYDEVKLSDKLEMCTKLVIRKENSSTDICMACITKLRVSYQFLEMCKKSTKILQGYLRALISKEVETVNPEVFVNAELSVVVNPLKDYNSYNICDNFDNEPNFVREKRRRITKEQRCSLLKRLLTPSETPKKERDKIPHLKKYDMLTKKTFGGLKNIINFTKNYEFGARFGVSFRKRLNYESTHLEKLEAFSNQYFRRDFSDFKNTILYIIENKDNLYESCESEDEIDVDIPCEESESKEDIFKFEEVIIEPDIKIKTEIDFEDDSQDYNLFSNLHQCKQEIKEEECGSNLDTASSEPSTSIVYTNSKVSSISDSMQFLNDFVGQFPHRRTFSSSHVRCRTRDNPYINPMLKQQFLNQSFRCEICSRNFKSPGYLKAHNSKVH